ncbi:uncharacterized protein LOC108675437 [Hyalella azteca]|uniref:Uncharacterized protein LOC108675437 n=1 Tax=Hyalella azteca TaxID=294128 RepID=A0A8B7NYU6_HYAAZ|nr:uncharacterized protein LOC108675437 [Hyalella azteca]
MMASALWKTVRPHVPLIRFRKGGSVAQELVRGALPVATAADTKTAPVTAAAAVLEDWQMPLRFRRKELSQDEIDCINSGGVC